MDLLLTRIRNDQRGLLGGYKGTDFHLRYRLQITDEEKVLVRDYKLSGYRIELAPLGGVDTSGHTIGSLLQGMQVTLPSPLLVIYYEYYLKQACDVIPLLFDIYRSQQHDETVMYPRDQEGKPAQSTNDS